MELEKWTASPVPSRGDELFNAIITARDGRQLISQCTTIEVADHIVGLHNSAAMLWIASEHPKQDAAELSLGGC